MDPYNFESLIQSGTQIIIPLQKPNLNLLRRPEVSIICDHTDRDLYLQLLLDKNPNQLMMKITRDQIMSKVILLMRDSKRVEHVNKNLKKVFNDLQISPAVDAMTPHAIDNFVQTHQIPIMKPIRAGKIGCFFSHYTQWKNLLNSLYPAVLVMEDDIVPQEGFNQKLDAILEELPPTFDILYLQLDECKNYQNRKGENYSSLLRKDVPREDTSAYLISRKGANKLVTQMKNIKEALGPMLKKQIESNNLETYTIKNALFRNIGQKTSNQELSQGILKSNTCDSQLLGPQSSENTFFEKVSQKL